VPVERREEIACVQECAERRQLPSLAHCRLACRSMAASEHPISKSQQKGKFYQSLNSKIKYYQREIPDDIWKLIMKLGIYYLGDVRGEFIDKMNKKYEKDKEILDKWEREEPDKNSKNIKKYYKKEKRDRVYWSHGFYNFRSNAFEIDDIKAFNKFYGIKTLWDIFNKVDD
jgi:hypothetical protein